MRGSGVGIATRRALSGSSRSSARERSSVEPIPRRPARLPIGPWRDHSHILCVAVLGHWGHGAVARARVRKVHLAPPRLGTESSGSSLESWATRDGVHVAAWHVDQGICSVTPSSIGPLRHACEWRATLIESLRTSTPNGLDRASVREELAGPALRVKPRWMRVGPSGTHFAPAPT